MPRESPLSARDATALGGSEQVAIPGGTAAGGGSGSQRAEKQWGMLAFLRCCFLPTALSDLVLVRSQETPLKLSVRQGGVNSPTSELLISAGATGTFADNITHRICHFREQAHQSYGQASELDFSSGASPAVSSGSKRTSRGFVATAAAAAPWRTIRLFLSSTFTDMISERDHLVQVVVPRLRAKCAALRCHLGTSTLVAFTY